MRNIIMTTVAVTGLLSGMQVSNALESNEGGAQSSVTNTVAIATNAVRRAKWLDSFKDAQAEAKKEKLPILLLYTAPEWCGPCRMLESKVLDTPAFMEFAGKNLVLLKADCSKTENKEAWLAANQEVAEKFKLEFFPMMYFFSGDMEKLGMIGGYEPEWNLKKYLEEIEKTIHP